MIHRYAAYESHRFESRIDAGSLGSEPAFRFNNFGRIETEGDMPEPVRPNKLALDRVKSLKHNARLSPGPPIRTAIRADPPEASTSDHKTMAALDAPPVEGKTAIRARKSLPWTLESEAGLMVL